MGCSGWWTCGRSFQTVISLRWKLLRPWRGLTTLLPQSQPRALIDTPLPNWKLHFTSQLNFMVSFPKFFVCQFLPSLKWTLLSELQLPNIVVWWSIEYLHGVVLIEKLSTRCAFQVCCMMSQEGVMIVFFLWQVGWISEQTCEHTERVPEKFNWVVTFESFPLCGATEEWITIPRPFPASLWECKPSLWTVPTVADLNGSGAWQSCNWSHSRFCFCCPWDVETAMWGIAD